MIQLNKDGIWQEVTKDQFMEAIRTGFVRPTTIIRVNGREGAAKLVRGVVFPDVAVASTEPKPPLTDNPQKGLLSNIYANTKTAAAATAKQAAIKKLQMVSLPNSFFCLGKEAYSQQFGADRFTELYASIAEIEARVASRLNVGDHSGESLKEKAAKLATTAKNKVADGKDTLEQNKKFAQLGKLVFEAGLAEDCQELAAQVNIVKGILSRIKQYQQEYKELTEQYTSLQLKDKGKDAVKLSRRVTRTLWKTFLALPVKWRIGTATVFTLCFLVLANNAVSRVGGFFNGPPVVALGVDEEVEPAEVGEKVTLNVAQLTPDEQAYIQGGINNLKRIIASDKYWESEREEAKEELAMLEKVQEGIITMRAYQELKEQWRKGLRTNNIDIDPKTKVAISEGLYEDLVSLGVLTAPTKKAPQKAATEQQEAFRKFCNSLGIDEKNVTRHGINDLKINSTGDLYYTESLLSLAVQKGNIMVVKELVTRGADVNERSGTLHDTPLWEAISSASVASPDIKEKFIAIAEFLISKGADINIRNQVTNGTILHRVVGFGQNLDVVKFVVSKGVQVNAKDIYGRTALDLIKEFTHIDRNADSVDSTDFDRKNKEYKTAVINYLSRL